MIDTPRIHNKRAGTAPPGAVYIGRGSPWGNPFVIGPDGTRDEVIEKFRRLTLPRLDVTLLRGKHLVCWCAPAACHGDLLLCVANACPGHIASENDPKVCVRCGVHVDEERP